MKILGLETSCDETAAAVVKDGNKILSSAIATSQDLHIKTGGIIPEVAARKQIESIIPVIDEVLSDVTKDDIDAIAVTYGPGLIGSLLVGVETAKTLALAWEKPIIPVNHLVAHIYANWVDKESPPEFPALALVVSGGHTDFVLMKKHNDIKYIGGTRDDAAGEAFDKTARILGLPYPGGPAIAEASEKYSLRHSGTSEASDRILDEIDPIAKNTSLQDDDLNLFPRPMINSDNLDMSFSGLKTAVLNYTKKNPDFDKNEMAANIQEAIVDTLVAKAAKAVEIYKSKSFILAGGVSANKRLREKIGSLSGKTRVFTPDPKHSTDNAVMIATAAFYNNVPVPWREITANPSLSIEE
jgi:N6-L-threonylcarbamoyladenine synthase